MIVYPSQGTEMEGEGKEPDEEVGTLFLSRSCLALIWDGGGCKEKWGVLVREVGERWGWREGNLCHCVGGSKKMRMDGEGGVGTDTYRAKRQQSLTSGSAGWPWEPKAGIKCSGHRLNLSVNVT